MNDAIRVPASFSLRVPCAGLMFDLENDGLIDAQGRAVELRPQALAVLRHLVLHTGRVVTKHELFDAVWPGKVVTDDSLVQAVGDIRAALGDVGRRCLKTVPRRGYLFSSPPSMPASAPKRNNVPVAGDALVGRELDVAAVCEQLVAHRLVTLVGAGGIGKTRLAQAVAGERLDGYPDGVGWVDLSALTSGTRIAPAVAEAASLALGAGEPLATLTRALAGQRMLLVLDNCEHLVNEAATLAQALLGGAPQLRLLCTSQEPLKVAGESLYAVDALAVPPPGVPLDAARGFGALMLLERRAQALDRHFELSQSMLPDTIALCRELDGLPLAIEMAAARLPVLGPGALRALLGERLRLLRGAQRGAAARHQTLRATLDWSHAHLSDEQKVVWRRLSVFAGSFSLASAQCVAAQGSLDAVAVVEALAALVEKSLLQVQRQEPPRYRLLETMRLYARERLAEAGEAQHVAMRHGEAMLRLAAQVRAAYLLEPDTPTIERHAPDYDDLQQAFERACEQRRPDVAAGTVLALRSLDQLRGIFRGIGSRIDAVHALLPAAGLRAQAQIWSFIASCGWIVIPQLSQREAARLAAPAWRELGDVLEQHHACLLLATECARAGAFDAAARALADADTLQQPDWPPKLRMKRAVNGGHVAMFRGDAPGYRRAMRTALQWAEQAGADRVAPVIEDFLADAALMAGEIDESIAVGSKVVADMRARGQVSTLGYALSRLARVQAFKGDLAAARSSGAHALPLMQQDGDVGPLCDIAAAIASHEGRAEPAATLLGAFDAWRITVAPLNGPSERAEESRLVERAEAAIDASIGREAHHRLRDAGADSTPLQIHALMQEVFGRPNP